MSDVINLDDHRKEYLFAALAICMSEKFDVDALGLSRPKGICGYRWIAGVPKDTSLFMLECPSCKCQDSFASILPSEYMEFFKESK